MVDEQNDPVLYLNGIKKIFSTDEIETHALSDVHLAVYPGEYVVIEGPSGSGKTTLLSVLGLLERPTSGVYELNGVEVDALDNRARARLRNRHIGFIFQSFNLIGDLSVWENVELPLLYGGLPSAERKARVDEALERVQMSHRKSHTPSQLSGGQQQRVAVARAIAGKPAILLADEPTGSLDSKSGEAVMNLLDELHLAGSTLCMVTHSHEFAQRASRAVQLFDGRIVADGARAA
jgi:putative ABC transport system ATP-binding protein